LLYQCHFFNLFDRFRIRDRHSPYSQLRLQHQRVHAENKTSQFPTEGHDQRGALQRLHEEVIHKLVMSITVPQGIRGDIRENNLRE
jgi:hypothetical protein